MDGNLVLQFVYNASVLLALSVVYGVRYHIPRKWKKHLPLIDGVLIGLIAIFVMSVPFHLREGISFDTRSILLSVAALIFGTVPACIAAGIAALCRVLQGGVGIGAGIAVILSSVLIGLVWRRILRRPNKNVRWLSIYLFGIVVHVAMLCCMWILPLPVAQEVLSQVAWPTLLVFPVFTVLLALLMLGQKERDESIERIVEAEGKYVALFHNHHTIMLLIDPSDGRIMEANPAACAFYGYPAEEMKKMMISQISEVPSGQIQRELSQAISRERNYFQLKHRNSAGETRDVEVYSGPIHVHGQQLLYSIVHDVTSRVATDQALKESQQHFRLVVEGAPDAIFIQTQGRFDFLNKAALRLFGAEKAEELQGMPVMERFHPEYHEVIHRRIDQLNRGKDAVPPNVEAFLRLDGSVVYVDVTAVPIRYNHENGALVFARDITERRRMEALQTGMEAQLRQQQKLEAIGTLAAGVAHEINNPINGIMNYAQLILDELEGNPTLTEYTREIIVETDRVSVIVRNLLQFSWQEKQAYSEASVYDIVNQTISLICMVIRKDQIKLDVFQEDGLPEIQCRSQHIQQVLMNLLTNARDALNEKYPGEHEDKMIRVRASRLEKEGRPFVRIMVEDHGNGIPEAIQDKIFEPFFSTKPKDKGTGLGLSISFGIVKDHHGSLSIDSREGDYTKIYLDLPVEAEGVDNPEIIEQTYKTSGVYASFDEGEAFGECSAERRNG